MGIFKLLKNVEGAEKLVKFKQQKLMSAAAEKGLIAADLFDRTRKGACAAYTMAWMEEKYASPAMSSFERSIGVDSSDATRSVQTAARHAPEQDRYQQSPHGVRSLFQSFRMHASRALTNKDLTALLLDLCETLDAGTGAYVSYQCTTDPKERHAVGLFRPDRQCVHFFDSNVGEYRISLAAIPQARERPGQGFFDQYRVLLMVKLQQNPIDCIGHVLARGEKSIGVEF